MSKAVARGIELPANAIVQTWGFLGRKGSGKTYAAGRLVEHFLDAGGQVVVLDPVGNWYGLRLGADGQRPSGFAIPVLGGVKGDVPLSPESGKVVAEFVVGTGSSCVLDVSQFRKQQRKQFVTAFAEELFHRKKAAKSPMHFVLEEAQVFAPEQAKGQEAMLGAIEDIVRLGRNVGIGCSLISQRPQSVNKEILNQVEPLVVFQLVAHHEREAVRKWMQHVGEDLGDALASLPSLDAGDCYFWSPAWMRIFQKTRFTKKASFDASATPDADSIVSGDLAPVDLEALRGAMSAAIEEAKASDPKALRKRVAELEREVLAARRAPVPLIVDDKAIEAARAEGESRVRLARFKVDDAWYAMNEAHALAHEAAERAMVKAQAEREAALARFREALDGALGAGVGVGIGFNRGDGGPATPRPGGSSMRPSVRGVDRTMIGRPDVSVPECRVLDALAWLEALGVPRAGKVQLALVAKYRPTSGGFNNLLGKLRTRGFLEYPSPGIIALTTDGRAAAAAPDGPVNGDALREMVDVVLSIPERRVLSPLLRQYPEPMPKAVLAERAEYSATSGGFNNLLGRLRTLGLIDYPSPGEVVACDLLFPVGSR